MFVLMSMLSTVTMIADTGQAGVGAVAGAACPTGIHVVRSDGGLTPLPRTKADHRKVSGMLGAMLTGPLGGNKLKVRTVLAGSSAATQLTTRRPMFRFCAAVPMASAAAASDYVGVADHVASLANYVLVRFETGAKQRELTLSASGGFSGPELQLYKLAIPFTKKEQVPGEYEIVPSRDLEPGQYGFIDVPPAMQSTRKKDVQEQVYDFAIVD